MKKLNKLVLKKESVANLTNPEMESLHGGGGSSGLPLSCMICTNACACAPIKKPDYSGYTEEPPPSPTQYGGHTAPPRCCNYGCCETVGC